MFDSTFREREVDISKTKTKSRPRKVEDLMDLDDAAFAEKEAAKFNETKHKSLVMHIDKLENMQVILNAEDDLIKRKSEYLTIKSPKWIHSTATLINCENKCKMSFVTSSRHAEK